MSNRRVWDPDGLADLIRAQKEDIMERAVRIAKDITGNYIACEISNPNFYVGNGGHGSDIFGTINRIGLCLSIVATFHDEEVAQDDMYGKHLKEVPAALTQLLKDVVKDTAHEGPHELGIYFKVDVEVLMRREDLSHHMMTKLPVKYVFDDEENDNE